MDDSRTSKVSNINSMMSSASYILFYQRRGSNTISMNAVDNGIYSNYNNMAG